MQKEIFTHLFENGEPLTAHSYNEAMRLFVDYEFSDYIGTFYLYMNPGIKSHDFINMKDMLPVYMEEMASEYRHEKYLKSPEATDRV